MRPTPGSDGTTTFLFTDVEGSTRQWEASPEMLDQVEAHFDVLRSVVDERGGRIFATMGDGIAAAFPSVEAAIDAAVAAQLAMPSTGLQVRMGLHTGEAERVGDDYRGRSLNRAARIMSVAHGGQIVLSDITATIATTGPVPVEVRDLDTHRLRDLEEPEHIWQVVHPELPARFPPLRGLDAFANNLPVQRTSLIGREDEVRQTRKALAEHRIVTLTGAGGVGKTRVALQAAADAVGSFQGVWFVPLASVNDTADVACAMTVAMGIDAPQGEDEAALEAALVAPTLLVVDNCEHVIDEAARLVDRLATACPELRILVTSREPLAIPGEQVVPVQPLEAATTASELFRQRMEAAGGELEPGDDEPVRSLCDRLDGLPLAIELAAARVPALGLRAVADGLDDRFGLLAAGRTRATGHHQRMHDTVDWSFQLLTPDEQRLFSWMAVFPAGFEMDGATHVGAHLGLTPAQVVEVVSSLAAKSMVVADLRPHGMRYRMLETLRAFATDHLEPEERTEAAYVLADWVASLADTPPNEPCSAEVERISIRLEREAEAWRDAVVTAIGLRSEDLAGRLCGPPTAYFLLGRHDMGVLLPPLLDLCPSGSHRRAVLNSLAVSQAGSVPGSQLVAWAEEILAIDADDPTGDGDLIMWIALAWDGDVDRSIQVAVAASTNEALAQDTRDMFVGIATVDRYSLVGEGEDDADLVNRAREVISRSEVVSQRVSCLLGVAWAVRQSQPTDALALTRQALEEMPALPAYMRRTLPGNACRLLMVLDVELAARQVLDQISAMEGVATFVDLIPAFYGATLLQGVGHPCAGTALATLAVSPVASYLVYVTEGAGLEGASQGHEPVPLDVMVTMIQEGLEEIVEAAAGVEGSVSLEQVRTIISGAERPA